MPTKKKPDLSQLALQERGGGIKGKPMNHEQIALIVKLSIVEDKTQEEIAAIMGCTQPTVSRILKDFTDTTLIAKARLRGAAETMAEYAIEAASVAKARGDASPALEILDRTGSVPKIRDGKDAGGPRVVVVVGSVPAPSITIDTVALPASTPDMVD